MSFKTTLTLLVVLIVLVGASWYLGVFAPPQDDKTPVSEAPTVDAREQMLIAPKLEDVSRMTLEVKGRGKVVFQKQDQKWTIIEPVEVAAVSWDVSDLVTAFQDAKKLRSFTPGAEGELSLEQTGLAEPSMVVTLEGDRTLTLQIGKNVVASENTYVRTGDSEPIAVVDVDLREKIKKDLKEYRDKRLWEPNKDKVAELVYTDQAGTEYKFVKTDGKWVMTSPMRAPVEKDTITKAIDTVTWLKAEEFAEDQPEQLQMYGLAEPKWRVVVTTVEEVKPEPKEGETQPADTQPTTKRTDYVVLVGNPAGLDSKQTYAKLADRPWVVTVKQEDLGKIIPDLQAWRDKKLIDAAVAEINHVEIAQPEGDVVLDKKQGTWTLVQGDQTLAVDSSAVDGLLNKLTELKAASFVDQPTGEQALDNPQRRIRIVAEGKLEPVEIAVGETTPSGLYRYAQRVGLDYLFAVPEETLQAVFKPAIAYRDRKVLNFDVDSAVAFEVRREDRTYRLEWREAGGWRVAQPVDAEAEQKAVKDLIMALATLQADSYVDTDHLNRYGLDEPDITVVVTTELEDQAPTTAPATAPTTQTQPAGRQYTLLVSRRDGKVYATVADQTPALVAQVGQQLYDDLSAELVRRSIFTGLSKSDAGKLTIQRAESTLEFVKDGDQWRYPADPVVQIDGTKVEKVIAAMAELKAKRYVSFDPQDADKYGLETPHITLTVEEADGETHGLDVARQAKTGRYAQAATGENRWVFTIETADVDKLDEELKDFVK